MDIVPYNIRRFIKRNRKECTFFVLFISIFIVSQSLYYFSRPLKIPQTLQHTNTGISSAIINIISPKDMTTAEGVTIKSASGYTMNIAWGCEGVEGIFMLIAALVAYTLKRKWKLYGILAGTALLFILNIFRLVFLFYTIKYKPALFDIMHVYVGQTFIIFFAVLFFIGWVTAFSEKGTTGAV
jgi:exosortase family protein XrtM